MQVIKSTFIILLLLVTSNVLYGSTLKIKQDTVTMKEKSIAISHSEQYTVSITANSDDLKWVALRKWYYKNSDTILVFNRKNVQKPELILQKMNLLTFVNEDMLLALGNGQAEFDNLKLKTKKEYKNVLQVAALKMRGNHVLYAILHKEGYMEICDLKSNVIHRIDGVISLKTVDNIGFIVNYEKDGKSHIIKINPLKIENLYITHSKIQKILVTDDKRYVLVGESFSNSTKSNEQSRKNIVRVLSIIHLNTGKVVKLSADLADNYDYFELSAIGKEGSYLLFLRKMVQPDNEMLEIWNGNESNIMSLYQSHSLKKFYIWKSETNDLISLKSKPEEQFIAFSNAKYLLKYHPDAGNNYTNPYPTIRMRLYDIAEEKETYLGNVSGVDQGYAETIYSTDGKWIIASPDHENWILYNLELITKTPINGKNLKWPLFTKNGESIYFESTNGLLKYDIQTKDLSKIVSGDRGKISILNGEKIRQFNEYYFASHSIDSTKPILCNRYDSENVETGYFVLKNSKKKNLIPMTGNRINDLKWNSSTDRFCFLEENYNLPTQFFVKKIGDVQKMVYQSNVADNLAKNLRKDVISYENRDGVRLRGTLYYPAQFNSNQKYPMVVKIYKMQRSDANEYVVKGGASYVGYDKRGLVERGYFVYEPDIIYGNEGPGRGALDCVNRAMGAIQDNKSIDFKRVALVGHSHGGYTTNFIATQSNLFATYISGAGNSDIVRSYFSYNRNFHTPFYFQFENGQYEMSPFVENKQLYFRNNPIHYVEQVNAPILLWAGKKDENIFWEQVQEFYIGLKRNKKDVIALFYNKVGHDLGYNTPEKADLHKRATEWLDYFLQNKRGVGWIDKQMIKR